MVKKTFFCVDAHTCGNPVRVVAGGGPNLTGANMSEKRQHFLKEFAKRVPGKKLLVDNPMRLYWPEEL